MTERVYIIAHIYSYAELLFKISLAYKSMSCKGFSTRNVTIRLNKPTAHNIPSAFFYTLFYFIEHILIYFFYPHIIATAGRCEFETIKFFHSVESTSKGRKNFAETLLPSPQPHRVQMSITYKMYFIQKKHHLSLDSLIITYTLKK